MAMTSPSSTEALAEVASTSSKEQVPTASSVNSEVLSGEAAKKKLLKTKECNNCNLSETYLFEANLRGANLTKANLRGAKLIDAKLNAANLKGADLRYAKLYGADLVAATSECKLVWSRPRWC